ncbi:PREDICTED: NXPE family member 2-like [Nanorana parkeri]|uniref:NXPE family member 2-like n=1 Tax=Nanorana parkeri TaxID=125878 RepID=UPI000854000C|nr:PREDICTED: NXPE family member 2-like [Nanorana parkeri]
MQDASYILSDGTVAQTSKLQLEIKNILNRIDQTIPKNNITIKAKATSAKDSNVFLRNPKSSYCVGDHLIVRVEMFDYQGNQKTYGGDFLRARMFTSELGAASSGKIEDFYNGTYHVHFTLFWEGKVNISIFLMHPSEGSSALWNFRNKWHGYVDHMGKYTKHQEVQEVECGFERMKTQELCEYKDERDEEYFYCAKPQNFSCESLTDVKGWMKQKTLFTEFEYSLFNTSNIRVKIPKDFDAINVLSCNNSTTDIKKKCTFGMKLEYPSGYVMKNVWYPKACSMLKYDHLEKLGECMQGKFIYLFGDSSIRMWILYFQRYLKTLTQFHLYEDNWARQILSLDMKRNMMISWKRHTFPFLGSSYQSWKEERTIAREIDLIGGDQRTVIALTIGAHFKAYPIFHFIRRLLNIRRAIERLFLRSPQTKVIIKTENTSAMKKNIETMSDFHASVHYSIMEIIFSDLNVGFVNGWDMTNAFDSNDVHPPETVVRNEVQMLMTYIC